MADNYLEEHFKEYEARKAQWQKSHKTNKTKTANATQNKTVLYSIMIKQAQSLTENENDLIANLSNICALIKETFNFWWIGFYLVKDNELVLGPFQGNVACTRIKKGKGVCGTSWAEKKTIIVPDVEKFAGHIACSSLSRSEIVIPVFSISDKDEITAVLDIDSKYLNTFDKEDATFLEKLTQDIIVPLF